MFSKLVTFMTTDIGCQRPTMGWLSTLFLILTTMAHQQEEEL